MAVTRSKKVTRPKTDFHMSFHVRKETGERIRALAARKETTVSDIARQIVERGLPMLDPGAGDPRAWAPDTQEVSS